MTVDEIVQRVGERSRLLSSGMPVSKPPLGSDFSLNGVIPTPTSFRPAAVLVPLVRREPGITVLLTQRTEDMPSHAGQIAFPGGRKQQEDADAKATALRETEEEVGLSPALVLQNFQIIKTIHASGVAVLMVEQNATMALSIADRGYVLSTGEIVLEGRAADLLQDEDLKRAYLGR